MNVRQTASPFTKLLIDIHMVYCAGLTNYCQCMIICTQFKLFHKVTIFTKNIHLLFPLVTVITNIVEIPTHGIYLSFSIHVNVTHFG